MTNVLSISARLVLALAFLALGLWCALLFNFHPPGGEGLRPIASVLAGVVAFLAALSLFLRGLRAARLALAATFLFGLLWFFSVQPGNDRNWVPEQRHPMLGAIVGDTLTVKHVRDFRWRGERDYDLAWNERRYDLSKAATVDLIMIHWMGPLIGHAIVSFGFDDGQVLSVSIEIRREIGEEFSPIAGFFRRFELIYLAADEQDLLGLSAAVRREDIRMFRIRATRAGARALLEAYVAEANAIAARAKFYNTVTVNCTTAIFTLVRSLSPGIPIDWRILINGFLPEYLYEIGAVDTSIPVAALRERGRIDDAVRAALGSGDFSARIREGVPVPR